MEEKFFEPSRSKAQLKTKKRRQGHYPEVLIGLLLILVGVVFSVFVSNLDAGEGVDVLVLASEIQKDEILEPRHLAAASVSSDTHLGFVLVESANALLGQRALLDLPGNVPILNGHFSNSPTLPAGHVLAGLRLSVGEYPSPYLGAGDLVDVVTLIDEYGSEPLLSRVEVYSAHPLGEGTAADMFVSLIVPDFSEMIISEAAQEGNIRLFLNPIQSLVVPSSSGGNSS